MDSVTDIVERLQEKAVPLEDVSRLVERWTAERTVAADTITALRAEVERWEKAQGIAFDQAMANGIEVVALRAEVERLREALESINRRASPSPNRTLGDCADELMWITDIARAALSSITGDE